MESVVKLHMGWTAKRALQKGIMDFNSSWDSLMTFCNAEPSVEFSCRCIWMMRLKVYTLEPGIVTDHSLAVQFRSSELLAARFEDASEHPQIQKKHVNLSIASILDLDMDTSDVIDIAIKTFSNFKDEVVGEYTQLMLNDVAAFCKLVGPFPRGELMDMLPELDRVLSLVPDHVSASLIEEQPCVALLRAYPKHGTGILIGANHALEEAKGLIKFREDVSSRAELLLAAAKLFGNPSDFQSCIRAIGDWSDIDTWVASLTDVQRQDLQLHLGNCNDGLRTSILDYFSSLHVFMITTWATDFETFATTTSLPKDHVTTMQTVFQIVKRYSASVPDNMEVNCIVPNAEAVEQWYANESLIVDMMNNEELTHTQLSSLFELSGTFDLVERTKLAMGYKLPFELVKRVQLWWRQPDISEGIINALGSLETQPSSKFTSALNTCLALAPITGKEVLVTSDESIAAITQCSILDVSNEIEILKRAATSRHNPVAVRQLDIRVRIIHSTVFAAIVDLALLKMQIDEHFIACAKKALNWSVAAQEVNIEDGVGMVEAEQTQLAFQISNSMQRRVAKFVIGQLDGASKAVWDAVPPNVIIDDEALLTSDRKKKLVLENPKKDVLMKSLATLSIFVAHAEQLQGIGYKIPDEVVADAKAAKASGKRVVGVEYVLAQFRDRHPNDAIAAKELVEELKKTLKKRAMASLGPCHRASSRRSKRWRAPVDSLSRGPRSHGLDLPLLIRTYCHPLVLLIEI